MIGKHIKKVATLVAFIALVTACHESELVLQNDADDFGIEVEFALADQSLEILQIRSAQEPPAVKPPHGEGTAFTELHYEFRDESGRLLAEGSVQDPRQLRGEWIEDGERQRQDAMVEQGLLSVHLPHSKGRLTLTEWTLDGPQELGGVDVIPDESSAEFATLEQSLTGTGDLLQIEHIHASHSGNASVTIAFVGDGYLAEEMNQYAAATTQAINHLFASDFGDYASQFDIYRIDVASPTSGVGEHGVRQDTPFGVTRDANVNRLIFPSTAADLSAALAAGSHVGADQVVVIANSAGYGGAALPSANLATMAEGSLDILDHELGHSLLNLADEYETEDWHGCSETNSPNVASSLSALPWADMIDDGVPLSTPETTQYASHVGAFEGANRCQAGWYRPQISCMMRDRGQPLCAVCRHQLEQHFAAISGNTSTSGANSGGTGGSGSSCTYDCGDYGYSEGQCHEGWECHNGCLSHTNCQHGSNASTGHSNTSSNGTSSCTYTCSQFNYSEGQCHEGWKCENGCLSYTGCHSGGSQGSGTASGNGSASSCNFRCGEGHEGNCHAGWICEDGCLRDVGCDQNNVDGASGCTYACSDYGYHEGQCYADWQCENGCLVQRACNGGNQGSSNVNHCTYACADYGYQEGECYDIWLCQDGCLVDVGYCG